MPEALNKSLWLLSVGVVQKGISGVLLPQALDLLRANFIFCTEHTVSLPEGLEDVQVGVGEFSQFCPIQNVPIKGLPGEQRFNSVSISRLLELREKKVSIFMYWLYNKTGSNNSSLLSTVDFHNLRWKSTVSN